MSKPVGPRQICTFRCANDIISIEERQDLDIADFLVEIGDDIKEMTWSMLDEYKWLAVLRPAIEIETEEVALAQGGRVVAYGGLRPNGDDWETTVVVAPDFRGQGLGRLMLRCADNMARRYRISSLIMHVASAAARKIANGEGWDDVGNDVVRREIK